MAPDIPGRRIEWFESIDSTMIRAAALARERCPHGTIVGADEQTAGVGRQGRSWHSKKGEGLYVSMVLRLPVESRALPVVMLALGLAAQEAIAQTASLAPDLRWPNDVLIGGRKCAGILAQLEGDAIIAGTGINVSQTGFPHGLATPATSLLLEGARVSREQLLAALAGAVDRLCSVLMEDGAAAILRMFEASSSYARGRRVRVEQEDGEMIGVTRGLDESGFLIVEQDGGKLTKILTGGVRAASAE
ncbi:MAG TPA: biotin--[acetyl-CoA-carboxylase] ligase [Bryobacteraceae bacterium]|nr:biotin--[acetyl-CoA-carboxylase] ligase [Bryobacteraceae bacterium]